MSRERSSSLVVSSGTVLFARLVGAGAFAGTNFLLARILGPEHFGSFVLISSFVLVGGFFAIAGLNRTLLRGIAAARSRGDDQDLNRQLILAGRVLRVALPFVALSSFLLSLLFLPDQGPWHRLGWMIAALAIFSGLQTLAGDVFRGYQDRLYASWLEGRTGGSLISVLFVLLLLPFAGRHLELDAAVALYLCSFAIGLVIAAARFRRYSVDHSTRIPIGTWKDPINRTFLVISATFLGTQLVLVVAAQIDLWIGGAILSASDVSAFAAASRLMLIVALPIFTMQLALAPGIAELYSRGEMAALQRLVRRAAGLAAVPSVLALIVIFLFPGSLLRLLYGPAYAANPAPLVWLAVGQLANSLTGLCGLLLAMTRYERDVLIMGAVGIVVQVLLGVPATIEWGVAGLAAASALTTTLFFLVQMLVAHRRVGVWSYPSWRSVFAEGQASAAKEE